MPIETKKNESTENEIVSAVAEAVTAVGDNSTPKEESTPTEENEKLDAQAELFVRRVVDGLTKNLSDLLNPPKKPKTEPKKESKPEVKQKPKNFMTFFGSR